MKMILNLSGKSIQTHPVQHLTSKVMCMRGDIVQVYEAFMKKETIDMPDSTSLPTRGDALGKGTLGMRNMISLHFL